MKSIRNPMKQFNYFFRQEERVRAKSESREIKKASETNREVRSSSMSKTIPENNETRATMVVRLHPGHHQKISTNTNNKVKTFLFISIFGKIPHILL